MFNTILIGLDGSEGAKRAIPYAAGLARRDGAKLVIGHVEEYTIGKGGGPLRANEGELEADLRQTAEKLTQDGVEASVETASVLAGGPAPALAAIADRVGADVIVVGTRGHTVLAGVVLGSVAQRLLTVADKPVMVIPEAAVTPDAQRSEAGSATA